jgi:tetratricopeptide (TPR) repeat protein
MGIFGRKSKTAPANFMQAVIQQILEEEGLPLTEASRELISRQPRQHLFYCNTCHSRVVYLGDGAVSTCPKCGRSLELIPFEMQTEMPGEIRTQLASVLHMRYGNECLRADKFTEAERSFTRVIALNPDPKMLEDAYYNRAEVRIMSGAFQSGITDCGEVIRLNPQAGDIYVKRANAKIQIQDCKGAVTDVTKALSMGIEKPFAYFIRGLAYLKLGDARNAGPDLEKFLKLAPSGPRADFVRKLCGHRQN